MWFDTADTHTPLPYPEVIMSQGKARDKEKVIEELKELFLLGYSVTKACSISGIPQSTVQTWIDKDDGLRLKINKWQNEINILARKQWHTAISIGRPSKFGLDTYTPAKEWLERKEKDEFSTREEVTGKDGESLTIQVTPNAGHIPEKREEQK